jgi:uncharacterized protein (TIGR04141 family)
MKRIAKRYAVSVYLSKKGASKEDCIDKEKTEEFGAEKIPLKSGVDGVLYVYSSKSELPEWIRYLEPIVNGGNKLKEEVRASFSNSALLVLKFKKINRCAIFTFGYGKSLIKFDKVETFFGRNVVLNSMKDDRILSLKSRSYDKQPRHKENQGTESAGLNAFEIDLQNEILQKLTGEYDGDFFKKEGFDDQSIGQRLTGYDSVSLSTSISLKDIEDLCSWLTTRFESDRYKKLLPDIDSFCPVKSDDLISKLDTLLLKKIKNGDLDDLHLSVPYALDTEEYIQFSIRGIGKSAKEDYQSDSLTVTDLYDALNDSKKLIELEIEFLKQNLKLICFSNREPARNKYPAVYRCLTGEVTVGTQTYALMDGDWYEIDADFFERIVKKLNKQVKTGFANLSPYLETDESEGGYNNRQCDEFGYLLFDQDLVKLRGRGGIEVCDLLCPTGKLIHVKRYTASSTLSHLFSQAYVSIKSLMEDEDFTERFLNKIEKKTVRNKIGRSLNDRSAAIILAIIMKETTHHRAEKQIRNLPAFSVVNLHKFVKDIETLGFKVTVQFVFH